PAIERSTTDPQPTDGRKFSEKKETNAPVPPSTRNLYFVAMRSPAVPHIVFQSVPTIWTTPGLSTRGPIPYPIHRRYKPNCPHNWGLAQVRSQPWQRKRSRLSDRRNVAHCRPCTCRADPRRERNSVSSQKPSSQRT